jgi:iron complex outermembrane receptor protein
MTLSAHLPAEEQADSLKLVKLEEVVISSTRAGSNTPIAYSNMNAADIKKNNSARNIPFILQSLPSVVAFSEDGSGVGNTSLRIRGTDATRINVTLNGMPLNNPESQEVYWVNLPDLSNSLQSVQLQRGVGTSTFGAAAFGASLSLKTAGARQDAYGEASTAVGSYNTFVSTLAAGTGVTKSGLSLDARYSRVTGDGYIRNGKVNHKNLYAALSHYTDNQLIRLSYINGIQHTGITWEGISPDEMKQYGRKYNIAGQYTDEAGNILYYDNETDNYYSDIVQLLFSRELTPAWTLNANLSYNHGFGYYENYKEDQKYSKFGLESQTIDGLTYSKTDVIRQKLMSNDFFAGNVSLDRSGDNFSITGGLSGGIFDGKHYGKLPWLKYSDNIAAGYEWYRNFADKQEIGGFVKGEYKPVGNVSVFGDLQYRYIDYRMKGIDDDLSDIANRNNYSFFNPKAGITAHINAANTVYASAAVSNREPLRTDIKEAVKGGGTKRIKPERVFDYELGYRYKNEGVSFNANVYYMDYKDQMVQTGKLNDVGYKLMENVPESYRAGIELESSCLFTDWLHLAANITLSRNKIKNYTAYFDKYDSNWEFTGQIEQFYKSTDISFSPNIVGGGVITVLPAKNLSVSFTGKYVGEQYYDNTSNSENRLDGYFVGHLTAGYTFRTQKIGNIDLQLTINNLLNNHYIANAWVDTSYVDDAPDVYKGFFPQATRNIMAKIGVRF